MVLLTDESASAILLITHRTFELLLQRDNDSSFERGDLVETWTHSTVLFSAVCVAHNRLVCYS